MPCAEVSHQCRCEESSQSRSVSWFANRYITCHSGEPGALRTNPAPRKPGKLSASAVPARIHATISSVRAGSARRETATVTGTACVVVMPVLSVAGGISAGHRRPV